jgi:hypothetical protein
MDPKADHRYTLIYFHGLNGHNYEMIDNMLGGGFASDLEVKGELIVDKHTRIILP